ncbi:MAG: nplT 2 [Cyanobacteria bacterium RYN_339]|nr:nplT 2 [Cyanobacteria bacterium RYN_339]
MLKSKILAAALVLAAWPAQAAPTVVTPEWVKHAVFYQIFPERFANGDKRNDPPGTKPWGSAPTIDNYMGGDLDGVTQHLDHLQDLGVNAIYFNPVFTSDSNHKYHTVDYMHVDPHFGGDAALQRLIKAAHKRNIKVVLDGVFNHTGDSHPFFVDAAKNGPKSKYWNWYRIDGLPVVKNPKPNYDAWWGLPSLPKLQVAKNPDVAKYIYQVEEHWLKAGIDGWRLDVPNEIDSDAFWQGFRRRAKAINPNAYIVGEIWDPADRWLQGDQFDAVMNYQWRDAMLKFFGNDSMKAGSFDTALEGIRKRYHGNVTMAMFNVLDSHDTMRFQTEAGGDPNRLKLASLFQMSYVGAPVIYYGDEIGLQGGKDPDDRRCFPWDKARWNQDLLAHYKQLTAARRAHNCLATGSYRTLYKGDTDGVFAFARQQGMDHAVVALNNSGLQRTVTLEPGPTFDNASLTDVLGSGDVKVLHGKLELHLDPRQGVLLVPRGAKR